jgi:hypothetical protein
MPVYIQTKAVPLRHINPEMDASIVVCTRDRAASLSRALTSIAAMRRLDNFSWELLVVDNGSRDHTAAVVQGFADKLPVSLVSAEAPGLSRARNCGVAAARGKYVIWTDDDVVVANDWLSAYAAAFAHWPEAAIFGGKIIPVLEQPSPRWFVECLDAFSDLLAARDFGPKPTALSESLLPFGANFAVRADVQRRFTFDPALGAQPTKQRVGEETAVLQAILRAGGTGVYVPDAVVHHQIPLSRQQRSHVMAYYRAQGATALAVQPTVRRSIRARSTLLISLVCKIAAAAIIYGCTRPLAPARVSMRYYKTLARALGQAALLRETAADLSRPSHGVI